MSSQQGGMPPPSGPPYASRSAAIGGIPTIGVDVPLCAVFLALFLGAAVAHMTIFQMNKKKGRKFILSALMFGFCMARSVTMVMRLTWATRPNNVRVSIAASIFTSAGVLILFLVNLIFAQRLTRAAHPRFGWHKTLSIVFKVLYVLIVVMLAIVITAAVQIFYTLDTRIRRIDRNLQLMAGSYLLFIAFLPIPLVILLLITPRKSRVEKFGVGRWRTKVCILLTASLLLCLGAGFRLGVASMPPRPLGDPAWYHADWCYWFFNFVIEAIVIYLYIIVRVDRRFHVPNGSKRSGDYSGPNIAAEKDGNTHPGGHMVTRIMSEEEVFDDEDEDEEFCDCEEAPTDSNSVKDIEAHKQDESR